MNKSKFIYLAIGALVLFLLCMIVCINYAPVFSYCVIITFVLSFGFIATEGWFTHAASEFENRFWSGMAFFFACACVFAPDSPLRLSRNVTQLSLAIPIVFAVTYLIHIYDRHLRRVVLNKVPNIMKRMRSADFNFNNQEKRLNAQQKLTLLRNHLDMIDQQWLSSTFQNIFLLPRVLQIEHSIITILSEVTDDQLNFIITKVQLGRIFYKVKDHKIAGRFNRTKLLELLAVTRLKELSVFGKAMLIHGFQIMKLSAHPLSEVYVKNIIFSTKEDDLSELKSLTDSKGDIYSMHKLIYEDIRDKSIQNDILNFISLQARIQQGHNLIKSRKGKKRSRLAWKKILSDVDDTLTSSGGSYPAGVDVSYPKKALYPGVLAFYRELDLGVTGDEEWNDSLQGNLVFLSARPHVYKDMSEHITYDKFKLLQERRGLHTSPSLLAGSLNTGSKYILQDDLEPLAENKFRKLTEYIALYPEYSCILIGDNGQGDVRATEMVLENNQYRVHICRAFIHEVLPLSNTHARRRETKTRYGVSNICYFKTYVDAAVDAYQQNLIRLSGLRRIMMESIIDFELISQEEWRKCDLLSAPPLLASSTSGNINTNDDYTNNSSNANNSHSQPASSVLGTTDNISNLSKSVSNSGSGSNAGNSSTSNPTQDIYSSAGIRTRSFSTVTSHRSNAVASMKTKDHKKLSSSSSSLLLSHQLTPESKHDLSLRDLNTALTKANLLLAKHRLPLTPLKKYIGRYNKGTAVKTPYGKAVITRFRPYDGVYEVLMQWDATGTAKPIRTYLQASSLTPLLPTPSPLPQSITSATSFSMSTAQLNTIMSSFTVASIAQTPAACLPPSSSSLSSFHYSNINSSHSNSRSGSYIGGSGSGTPTVRDSSFSSASSGTADNHSSNSPRPLTAVTAAGSMASRMLGSFSFRSTTSASCSAANVNKTNTNTNTTTNNGISGNSNNINNNTKSSTATPVSSTPTTPTRKTEATTADTNRLSPVQSLLKSVQFDNVNIENNIIASSDDATLSNSSYETSNQIKEDSNNKPPQKESSFASSSFSPQKATQSSDAALLFNALDSTVALNDENNSQPVTPTKISSSINNSTSGMNSTHTTPQKYKNSNTHKNHFSPLMSSENSRSHTPTRFSTGSTGSISSTASIGGREVDNISKRAIDNTGLNNAGSPNTTSAPSAITTSPSPLFAISTTSLTNTTATTTSTVTNITPPMISLPSVSPLTVPPILGSLFSRITSSSSSPLTTVTATSQPLLNITRTRSHTTSAMMTGSTTPGSVTGTQVMTASFIGGMMWTPYGIGEAVDYRLRDDMIVIRAPLPVLRPVEIATSSDVEPVAVDDDVDDVTVTKMMRAFAESDTSHTTDVADSNTLAGSETYDNDVVEIGTSDDNINCLALVQSKSELQRSSSSSSSSSSNNSSNNNNNNVPRIPYSYLIFSPRLQVVQITLPFLTQSPFRTMHTNIPTSCPTVTTTATTSAGVTSVLTHSRQPSLSPIKNLHGNIASTNNSITTATTAPITTTNTTLNDADVTTTPANIESDVNNINLTNTTDDDANSNNISSANGNIDSSDDSSTDPVFDIAAIVAEALDEILTQAEHDSVVAVELLATSEDEETTTAVVTENAPATTAVVIPECDNEAVPNTPPVADCSDNDNDNDVNNTSASITANYAIINEYITNNATQSINATDCDSSREEEGDDDMVNANGIDTNNNNSVMNVVVVTDSDDPMSVVAS